MLLVVRWTFRSCFRYHFRFQDRGYVGGLAIGSQGVFDDSFEDRSDVVGFGGGSKVVCDDSFEDRNDFNGSEEVRRQFVTTVSRIVASSVVPQEVQRLFLPTVSRIVAIFVVPQEVRKLFLPTVSRIVAILVVSQGGGFAPGVPTPKPQFEQN